MRLTDIKEKAQKFWGQLTPKQQAWVPRILLLMGVSFLCKVMLQTVWPHIGLAILWFAISTGLAVCFISLLRSVPRLRVLMPWVIMVLVGVFSNHLVVIANNGHMPSSCQDVAEGFYIPIVGTRLAYLSDWIFTFVSPGDVLILIGLMVAIVLMMGPKHLVVEQESETTIPTH